MKATPGIAGASGLAALTGVGFAASFTVLRDAVAWPSILVAVAAPAAFVVILTIIYGGIASAVFYIGWIAGRAFADYRDHRNRRRGPDATTWTHSARWGAAIRRKRWLHR